MHAEAASNGAAKSAHGQGHFIGELIRKRRGWKEEDIERIVSLQSKDGIRFGEAAIALRLATEDDVLWALSQQFEYPYVPNDSNSLPRELIVASNPFSDGAELFRDLRSSLLPQMADRAKCAALAVTSLNTSDGKTFFASNLAVAFSQLGRRTLLIDADMRTPRAQEIFSIPGSTGLSGLLAGKLDAAAIHDVVTFPNLFVMPVGVIPPNPLELLQRPVFGALLRELSARFDYIVVDTPAASHGVDAKVIAAHCGLAIAVGRRFTTRLDDLRRFTESIAKLRCSIAGVVMNEH